MNNNESAFPFDYGYWNHGMTLKEYAAIHLKVPRSGNAELDAMIRESVRRDFAGKMIDVFCEPTSKRERMEIDAKMCFAYADVMLAEWEKGK